MSEQVKNEELNQRLQSLSIRSYLDSTVVPLLLQSLTELAKERPDKPIEYVANYLLKNNPENQQKIN